MATTKFHHAQRNGKRKRPKKRQQSGMGIGGDAERLLIHRELEFLRVAAKKPQIGRGQVMAERARKLSQSERLASKTSSRTLSMWQDAH